MKTILAIDLGKHNSVFCRLEIGSSETQPDILPPEDR